MYGKNSKGGFQSIFLLRNTRDAIDIFQKPLPTFNIRGRRHISTTLGCTLSFITFCILFTYASVKWIQLLNRHNPAVSSFLKRGVFDSGYIFNFESYNIRFAFGVEGFFDKQTKDDPRYVKGLARFWGYKEGRSYERIYPYHKCTAEDFARFAPPAPEAEGLLKAYTEDPKRYLFCLDWERYGDELAIWGIEDDEASYQRFEFVLFPCNYVHTEFGDTGDSVSEECIASQQE